MFKNLILIFLINILVFCQLNAQNLQVAHQLTQSCVINTDGKILINSGGHYTTSFSEQVFLRDSLRMSTYDTASSMFKNNKRAYFAYDSGGLLTESVVRTIDKNGVNWSNSQHSEYKYSGFHLYEETYYSWDKTLADWANFTKNKYTYESDSSLKSIFYEPWNAADSIWDYSTLDVLTYDQNKKVTTLANQKWNKNLESWDKYLRVNFTYQNGKVSEKVYQVWNSNTQLWDDYQKETISYEGADKSEVIIQLYSIVDGWVNSTRNVFTYTNFGQDSNTEYIWSGSWVKNKKMTYTYLAANIETVVVTQQWQAHLNSYRDLSKDESFYTQREVFGVDETPIEQILVNNPLSKSSAFTIKGLKENKKYELNFTSMNGSKVFSATVHSGQKIESPGNLNNGFYILTVSSSGEKMMTQKILITD